MSRFYSDPFVKFNGENNTMTLTEDFSYYSDLLGVIITVLAGTTSDGVSVPAWLRPFIDNTGACLRAAIIHDYLYKKGKIAGEFITRKMADKVFLEAMATDGVSWLKRYTAYSGVRLGGWVAWNGYRENEKLQESCSELPVN